MAFIVVAVLRYSGYSVKPHGILEWGFIVAIATAYVLLANWCVSRLRRAHFFSRTNSGVRVAVVVTILSVLLLLTTYLIRYVLETGVST